MCGVVRCGGKVVCAGAESGQIDTDQCKAVCDVFFVEVAVADPALGAGEVFDRLGALYTARDLDP